MQDADGASSGAGSGQAPVRASAGPPHAQGGGPPAAAAADPASPAAGAAPGPSPSGPPGGEDDAPAPDARAGPSSVPDAPVLAGAGAAPPAAAPGGAPSGSRRRRGPRRHPYAHERSTPAELRHDAGRVTAFWLGLAVGLVAAGWWLSTRYSTIVGATPYPGWEQATLIPLFAGLALLGFGWRRGPNSQRLVMVGWILFASYWALTALDLLVKENQDYANYTFALLGVFFFTYLAYHEWLSTLRGVENQALRFLSVATFLAAGSYFLIDKVQWLRTNLILLVSDHTNWGLELFGQGKEKGLVYVRDPKDVEDPATFFYPDYYCEPSRPDGVGAHCQTLAPEAQRVYTDAGVLNQPYDMLESLLLYTPEKAADALHIVPVSIILACTAVQSIMLFVGLFWGTTATWQRKLKASLVVAVIVYVLNLLRNVGIIWFYGQGDASFWVMHNAIGKGGSLLAMVAIAFAFFRFFPEFFQGLVSVLDLPERDGPIERTLRLGRRRPPEPPLPAAPVQA